jgi:hypothetical protein
MPTKHPRCFQPDTQHSDCTHRAVISRLQHVGFRVLGFGNLTLLGFENQTPNFKHVQPVRLTVQEHELQPGRHTQGNCMSRTHDTLRKHVLPNVTPHAKCHPSPANHTAANQHKWLSAQAQHEVAGPIVASGLKATTACQLHCAAARGTVGSAHPGGSQHMSSFRLS